jgi:hypothetical protein
MGTRQRLNAKITSFFHRICCRKPEAARVSFDEDIEEGGVRQYRLEATRKVRLPMKYKNIRIFMPL